LAEVLWNSFWSTKSLSMLVPWQPPPETVTICPLWTSLGETTNAQGLGFALGLALDQAGAASATRALAAVIATDAADILRMRSSLG
jgi:hypothetical protein